jgi:hypothetical protein
MGVGNVGRHDDLIEPVEIGDVAGHVADHLTRSRELQQRPRRQ